MTRDDIIRMARTAICLASNDHCLPKFDAEKTILDKYEFLYWFAREVAAHEREMCAKVCDEAATLPNDLMTDAPYIAAAIRTRGEK